MTINVLTPIKPQVPLTAATSPAVGNFQPYDATAGNLAPVLPALSGVADGAQITVEKIGTDVSTNTVTVTRAGADLFYGGGTTMVLKVPGHRVELMACTIGGTRFWRSLRESIPVASMDTRYDAFGAAAAVSATKGAASGIASLDASSKLTRAQVPTLPGGPVTASTGTYQQTTGLISVVAQILTGYSGIAYWMPFDVGPGSGNYNALAVNVTIAQVAGTTTTTLGAYPDDGTGGKPLLTSGPLVSGAVTLTSTGIRTAVVAWTPTPGRYWLAFLFVASVNPTTFATISAINATAYSVPLANYNNFSAGWGASGLAALPSTAIAITPTTGALAVSAKAV